MNKYLEQETYLYPVMPRTVFFSPITKCDDAFDSKTYSCKSARGHSWATLKTHYSQAWTMVLGNTKKKGLQKTFQAG